jgi:hypothetical protein
MYLLVEFVHFNPLFNNLRIQCPRQLARQRIGYM